MPIFTTSITTPIGTFLAGATDDGICMFEYPYRRMIDAIKSRIATGLGMFFEEGNHPHFKALLTQLNEYFNGSRTSFDLLLKLVGTEFQKSVWNALLDIPYGETRSYKAQSIYLKNEKAIRAIASANGANGLAILIPCHRVIGENGSLVGYAGGLQVKQWLLEHERKVAGIKAQGRLF